MLTLFIYLFIFKFINLIFIYFFNILNTFFTYLMLLYIYFCKMSTLIVPVCESICKSLMCAVVCDC